MGLTGVGNSAVSSTATVAGSSLDNSTKIILIVVIVLVVIAIVVWISTRGKTEGDRSDEEHGIYSDTLHPEPKISSSSLADTIHTSSSAGSYSICEYQPLSVHEHRPEDTVALLGGEPAAGDKLVAPRPVSATTRSPGSEDALRSDWSLNVKRVSFSSVPPVLARLRPAELRAVSSNIP